jgi:RNA polymerase sigma-70 factor (ECF subfamily)
LGRSRLCCWFDPYWATAPGLVWIAYGRPFSYVGFTVGGGRIIELDVIADPERLARLGLAPFDDPRS